MGKCVRNCCRCRHRCQGQKAPPRPKPRALTRTPMPFKVACNAPSSALIFDGTSTFVDLLGDAGEEQAPFEFTTELTVASWVLRERRGDCRILDCTTAGSAAPGFGLDCHENRLRFLCATGNVQSSCSVPFGEWVHVAATFSSRTGRIRLYVNGDECGSGRATAPLVRTNVGFYLGRAGKGNANSGLFKGRIARVALWDEELSGISIKSHAMHGLEGNSMPLHYYELDEASIERLSATAHRAINAGSHPDAVVCGNVACARSTARVFIQTKGAFLPFGHVAAILSGKARHCQVVFEGDNGTWLIEQGSKLQGETLLEIPLKAGAFSVTKYSVVARHLDKWKHTKHVRLIGRADASALALSATVAIAFRTEHPSYLLSNCCRTLVDHIIYKLDQEGAVTLAHGVGYCTLSSSSPQPQSVLENLSVNEGFW